MFFIFCDRNERIEIHKTHQHKEGQKGEDQMPPKLIKTVVNFLVELLTDIINSYFSTSTFPDPAKRASVTPIDKGCTNKHICTNYRPVSVLNTFSNIIESSIFDQLTKHAN